MAVVSNTSPLIYLAALSDFGLLPKLFGEIQIPPAVWTEIVEQGPGLPGCDAVRQAVTRGSLRLSSLEHPAQIVQPPGLRLHAGEIEVIQLGLQLKANTLLMNDRTAVAHARSLGFRVAPTVAIYILAKRRGMIPSVRDKADQLRRTGFRLTDRDYEAVLDAAGEL